MCRCLTAKGALCKNKAVTGSVYCRLHQKCKTVTKKVSPKKTVAKKAKTTKLKKVLDSDTRPGIRRSPLKDVGKGNFVKAKHKAPVRPKMKGKIVKKASPEIVGYKNVVFKKKPTRAAPKTVIRAVLTGNKDVDEKILLRLDPKSLIAFCKTNKTVNSFCKNNPRIKAVMDYYLLPVEAMKRLTKLKNSAKPLIMPRQTKPQKYLLHFIDEIYIDGEEIFYDDGDITNYIFIENPWTNIEEYDGGIDAEDFKKQIEKTLKGIPFYYRDDQGFLDNFGDQEIGIVIGEKGKDIWSQYAKSMDD